LESASHRDRAERLTQDADAVDREKRLIEDMLKRRDYEDCEARRDRSMSFTKKVAGPAAFMLLLLLIGAVHGQVDEPDAAAALAEADWEVAVVFEGILDAEAVGADVSALLEELNTTCTLLATAHVYYAHGNFSGALVFAELTRDQLERLEAAVTALGHAAAMEQGRRLSSTVTASVVGAVLAPLVGVLGWRYVKAWFVRRMWKMKPEVRDADESQ
jgi:hypothetical protein